MLVHDDTPTPELGLTTKNLVTEVLALRAAALASMEQAVATLDQGHKLAAAAKDLAEKASKNTVFHMRRREHEQAFKRLFEPFDPAASARIFREHLDATVWMHLIETIGIGQLMDKAAKDQLYNDLCGGPDGVPEATEENVYATFSRLVRDSALIFRRGLANAFAGLDRRFRSHDGFKIGSRIVLTRMFDEHGYWSTYSRQIDTLKDVERVLAVLDGKLPNPRGLVEAINEGRGSRCASWGPRQGEAESAYFRVRTFKNGNAHLWFTRDDLVERANLELAEYFGAVLADAVPGGVTDIKSSGGALSKDLAFYRSPPGVVARLLDGLNIRGARTLEPSAGDGAIVRGLLAAGAAVVDAIEVDPGRVTALCGIKDGRLSVASANFLQVAPRPVYDVVAMNPPFSGTHWIEHVVHAAEFLAPGGTLASVLPATAETGDTAKHEEFRKWVSTRGRFFDLPPESFAESGTRINTVMLVMTRPRR